MAIRDGIKNAVASNIGAAVNRTVSSSLRRVAGNLFGVDLVPGRGTAGGPTAPIRKPNKYTTKNLAYPTGVEADPTQGHYIIFEILAQNPGKLKAFEKKAQKVKEDHVVKKKREEREKNLQSGAADDEAASTSRDNADAPPTTSPTSGGAKGSDYSIQIKNKSTTRLDTNIALYMPPSVQVSYDVKYGDTEIGAAAETGGAAIKAFMQGGGFIDSTVAAGKQVFEGAKAGAAQFGMKQVAGMAQGGDALIAIERGQVITPRMELLFEGMGRRSFNYSFVFIPKSEREADIIEEIVKTFKKHMMPNFAEAGRFGLKTSGVDGVREMTIPDHFNIKYMHMGKPNPHLNLISTCALTKMDVDYGAERFTAYAGGRPQTTKISLSFTEFNIMSRDQIEEGH